MKRNQRSLIGNSPIGKIILCISSKLPGGITGTKLKWLNNYVSLHFGGETYCFCPTRLSVCLSVRLSVCQSHSLSAQLLWNYWTEFHETWKVVRTPYVVVYITRKFLSPEFCGSYAPLNLEICRNVLLKQLISATPLKLLNRISWNLVGSKDTIRSCAFYQEILIP